MTRTTMQTAVTPTPLQSSPREEGRRLDASIFVLSTAELAECNCPDACERDHDRD